jgi:hypothetical protein
VGWHYIGRSWDGIRFNLNQLDLDLFGLTVNESVGYISAATPVIYPYPAIPANNFSVYGFWKKFELNEEHQLDLFGYYEFNRNLVFLPGGSESYRSTDRFTLGLNHFGSFNNLSTIIEAAYQGGKAINVDIAAYLLSVQGNYKMNELKIGAGVDILSGTEPGSAKNNSFAVPFGTNHKFYGFMDYFINIPVHTYNFGLHDFYLLTGFAPENSRFNFSLNLHHFMSNKETRGGFNTFGQELDLTINYNIVKGAALSWGGSLFFPGDIMKLAFAPGEDPAFWTYLMVSAAF